MGNRVAVLTLGCRANQYDSELLERELSNRGLETVSFDDWADCYLLNTCTVTHAADREARRLLRGARQKNPKALLVVTGCYAQVSPEELQAVDEQCLVIGNGEKGKIVSIISERLKVAPHPPLNPLPSREGKNKLKRRSRAYVKIQDGCDYRCSFCIIPFARGASRSRSILEIVEELRNLQREGFHEAVLTGIHIGSYGRDLKPRISLLDLMEVLERERPMKRIRLSTLDPDEVSFPMIDRIGGSGLFCPHLHIAIQSGSDEVLKKMRRRHTMKQLVKMTSAASARIKDLGMGCDLIAGFPTEQASHHAQTKALLKDLPLTYFHVFPYSERKGTHAVSYPESVPRSVRKERGMELIELGEKKKTSFWLSQIGKKRGVIVEGEGLNSSQKGMTDNYIPVWMRGLPQPKGAYRTALLEKMEEGKVFATCR